MTSEHPRATWAFARHALGVVFGKSHALWDPSFGDALPPKLASERSLQRASGAPFGGLGFSDDQVGAAIRTAADATWSGNVFEQDAVRLRTSGLANCIPRWSTSRRTEEQTYGHADRRVIERPRGVSRLAKCLGFALILTLGTACESIGDSDYGVTVRNGALEERAARDP